MSVRDRPAEHHDSSGPREPEPEGFGEAVAAGSVTLALMVSIATVGFAWERRQERAAHGRAAAMVERLGTDGASAPLLPWSGLGRGPSAPSAQATFAAIGRVGPVRAHQDGHCVLASKFALCAGTRYACRVTGETPVGPVAVALGLCNGGAGPAWTFDSLDATLPASTEDLGNRDDVDVAVDGPIRFGAGPPPPDPIPARSRRRGLGVPFSWSPLPP